MILTTANVSTISDIKDKLEGSNREKIILLDETRFHIMDALYSSIHIRNLLSFNHIETMNEENTKCLYSKSIVFSEKLIVEKLSTFPF